MAVATCLAFLAVLQDPQDPLLEHARLYDRVAPAVVAVSSNGQTRWQTGVVVTEDGYLLTTEGVVRSRSRLFVRFADAHQVEAPVVARDRDRGWLLARLPAGRYAHAPLGDSRRLQTGDVVYTLGDSFSSLSSDGEAAISMGVVSDRYTLDTLGEVIETTAAVNPGQEGSPLVTPSGDVVGIAVMNYHPARYAGTALPSESFSDAVRAAIETDRRTIAAAGSEETWFGWELTESANGVSVQRVYPDGPAARAGVRVGDVVVSVRKGSEVASGWRDMRTLLSSATTQDEFEVRIRRGEEDRTLTLQPEEVIFY